MGVCEVFIRMRASACEHNELRMRIGMIEEVMMVSKSYSITVVCKETSG